MYLMNTIVNKINERKNIHMKDNAIRKFRMEKSGDATLNWILGVVISIAFVAAVIALVNNSLPTIWQNVLDKITAVLS